MRKLILVSALLVLAASGIAIAAQFYVAGAPFEIATGFIPPDAPSGPIGRCERRVAKNAGKLAVCLIQCKDKSASLQTKAISPIALQTCQDNCTAAFTEANGKLRGCVPCIDQAAIARRFQAFLGKRNGDFFCANDGGSPSGAFLDGPAPY